MVTTPYLIASYGGSGSTFLTHELSRLEDFKGCFVHTHSVPENNFLGCPIFNPHTGHAEGPFSKEYELDLQSKIIVIYREPAEAYLSRASFKHFLHLWAETERMTEVFGEGEVTPKRFNEAWSQYAESGRDIMGLEEYLNKWRKYAQQHRHSIAFVKYEALQEAWPELLGFLDVKQVPLCDFSPRERFIPAREMNIFSEFSSEIATWPPIEIFKQDAESLLKINSKAFSSQSSVLGSSFSITGLNAGMGDSISRLAVTYNYIKALTDLPYVFEKYVNYHSPDTDFFSLFGLDKISDKSKKQSESIIEIKASDFIFHALHEPGKIQENTHYEVSADIYPNDPRLSFVKQFLDIPESFYGNLSYIPEENPFKGHNDYLKVVIHLRRQDIILGEIEEYTDDVPEKLLSGLHKRGLLTAEIAMNLLESRVANNEKLSIIIVSDGVERVRKRFGKYPEVVSVIDRVNDSIFAEPYSDKLDIKLVEYLVGVDSKITRQVLDAMYCADIVVTASSSFPNLICSLGETKLIVANNIQ